MNAQLHELPIDPAIVQRASEWMARLWSDEVREEDRAACAAWRAAHPDHERAWNRLQAFEEKLVAVPRAAARRVLLESPPTLMSRRAALRLLSAAVVFGGMAYTVRRTDTWKLATSDYVAGTGDIQTITLPDGTQVTLDTASTIDVHYSGDERRVVLRTGRIYIATAPDPMTTHRPFLVEHQQGTVRALGTRYSVRQDEDTAQVAVYQGAVEIRPRRAPGSAFRLDAGQRTADSSDDPCGRVALYLRELFCRLCDFFDNEDPDILQGQGQISDV